MDPINGVYSTGTVLLFTLLPYFPLPWHPVSALISCDEDIYYQPYAVIKKKKNGGDLASMRSTGFMDLRHRSRVLLCINGPAVLYADVERIDTDAQLRSDQDNSRDSLRTAAKSRLPSPDHGMNTDNVGEEELRFRKPELKVFTHQCIAINKVPTNVLKKMKEDQNKANPEIMSDTPTMGRLVLGVFLIGNKDSYLKPELAWFKGTNYEYVKTRDKTVRDSSFILTNTKMSHCLKLPDGTHVSISGEQSKNDTVKVCRWTAKEEDKPWYAKVFQRGYDSNGIRNGEQTFEEGDYQFYNCPDSDPDRNIILTMGRTTPAPVSHTNYTQFDPFSLFNPNIWTPHGFRKDSGGLSGGDERTEDKAISAGGSGDTKPCSVDPTDVSCMYDGEGVDITTPKDMQNVDPILNTAYEILTGECETLSNFDPNTCSCAGDNGNRLLELALELVPEEPEPKSPDLASPGGAAPPGPEGAAPAPAPAPTDSNGTSSSSGPIPDTDKVLLPKWGNLNSNELLSWKFDILYQVAEIFQHLCMPFRPDFPYTVARIFAWYVLRAHAYGENMGRKTPGCGPASENADSQFDHLIKRPDTWIILGKELERCAIVAKNENGGKGIKFQWEVGDDSGKGKIPAVDGRSTRKRRRRKRSLASAWYPTSRQRQSAFTNIFFADEYALRRKRRSASTYNDTVPRLSNRYILPGKSLSSVKSEGTVGYVREVIQEFRTKPDMNDPRSDSQKYCDYPENLQHCWHPQEDPITKAIVCSKTEEVFFYEDKAEVNYELNIAIDLWWKIWATAIGYCNKAYHSRKSETFPRMYNSKYEYFFELVLKEWKWPQDNDDLKYIFSEYLTEENHVWLDACVEASYINSNSHSFRPPRPMSVEENQKEISNYFDEVPSYLYYRYHAEPSVNI